MDAAIDGDEGATSYIAHPNTRIGCRKWSGVLGEVYKADREASSEDGGDFGRVARDLAPGLLSQCRWDEFRCYAQIIT
jgi:hypothetical protein